MAAGRHTTPLVVTAARCDVGSVDPHHVSAVGGATQQVHLDDPPRSTVSANPSSPNGLVATERARDGELPQVLVVSTATILGRQDRGAAVTRIGSGLLVGYKQENLTVRKPTAAAGSAAFLVLAPGVVAGLVPWWLTGWRVRHPQPSWAWVPLRVAGGVLIAAGVVALVQAFVRFVVEGAGTPAPVAPTKHLVVGGLYRYVRNPMYLAVMATVVGQALALAQPALLGYAAAVGAAMVAFVYGYEEPTLSRQFGEQYQAYRRAVPAWWPRRHPWRPGEADPPTP